MSHPIRILVVDDSRDDTLHLIHELQRSGYEPVWERVATTLVLQAMLTAEPWDVVVLRDALPGLGTLEVLALVREYQHLVPCLVFGGRNDVEVAVAAMRAGAADYLLPEHRERLVPAIEHALRDDYEQYEPQQGIDISDSNEIFRLIWESATEAIALSDANGIVLMANPAYYQLYGYMPEEVIGQHFSIIFPEQERQQSIENYQHLFYDFAAPTAFEVTVRCARGGVLHVDSRIAFIEHAGERVAMLSVVRDITERKEIEDRLRLFESVVAHANDAVLITEANVLDMPGPRIVYVNQAFERMSGHTAAEVIGQTPRILQGPETDRAALDKIRSALEEWRSVRVELLNYRKDGTPFWIEMDIYPLLCERHWPTNWIAIQRDVTERRRAEEALRRSEERFRLLAEHAQDIVFRFRLAPDPGYDYISPSVRTMLGYTPEEIYTDPGLIQRIVHPESQPLIEQFAQSLNKNTNPMILRLLRRDGAEVWVEQRTWSVRDDTGQVTVLEGVVIDITERKRAEDEIHTLNQRLSRRAAALEVVNEELEAFSYSIAHDLRSPLWAIEGFSEALFEDYAETMDAEGRDFLQRIQASARHMADLIDDLLKLSRLSRGEMEIEAVNISTLVSELAADLQQRQPERRAEVLIADDVVVEGDRRLLRVALWNLLENAWKFTSKQPVTRIAFGVTEQDGQLIYFVRDNGVGFSMDAAPKLFGAFQRLHDPGEFSGTGIGLATVKRIIHRHSGRVWAESEPGKGATFFFTLLPPAS